MKYLVMECGLSYAVVLDEKGRFIKAANLNYEVGQELNEIIPFSEEKKVPVRKIFSITAIAACFCLISLLFFQFIIYPVGSVRMQINPDVRIQVNRMQYVVGLEGLNEDGKQLIEGGDYLWKRVEQVSDELADRAVEMGYLSQGGEISLTVDSDDSEWKTAAEEMILTELEVHFQHTVTITVTDSEDKTSNDEKTASSEQIIVIAPVNPSPSPQTPAQEEGEQTESSSYPTGTIKPTPKPTVQPTPTPNSSDNDDDDEEDEDDGDDNDEDDDDDDNDGEDDDDNDTDDDEE